MGLGREGAGPPIELGGVKCGGRPGMPWPGCGSGPLPRAAAAAAWWSPGRKGWWCGLSPNMLEGVPEGWGRVGGGGKYVLLLRGRDSE